MKRLAVFALALIALSAPCFAGEPPPPLVQGNGREDEMFQNLFDRFQKMKPSKPGAPVEQVPAGQAALCDICLQPLFKHGNEGFICTPIDPKTNLPHILPEIKTLERPVPCPVCNVKFQGTLPCNQNDRGGRDRDFCDHSIGKFTVHSHAWMCPECGFAAMIPANRQPEGFALALSGKPIDENVKKFVREKLSPPTRDRMIRIAGLNEEKKHELPPDLLQFAKYVPQHEIPDWLKYDNAIQIYEFEKAPHTLLARMYLEGAHACRREVCKEVSAPGLDQALQESLGKSIKRMNFMIQSECLGIRRRRGDASLDPTRAETDPRISAQAIAAILKVAKEAGAGRPRAGGHANQQNYFTTADLYVLFLSHAGALDRLGKIEEAEKALKEATSHIPEKIAVAESKELEARVSRQLRLLRSIAGDRLLCLQKEQEYLFKAARRNMAAIDRQEVKFRPPEFSLDPKTAGLSDPAPTAYLLGEMFRRASVPEAADAWLAAADRIIIKRLDAVDAAEKTAPPTLLQPVLLDKSPPKTAYEIERDSLLRLKFWTREQRESVKATKAPDEVTLKVIDIVLSAAGITGRVEIGPGVTVTSTPAAPAGGHNQPVPPGLTSAVPPAGSLKTRDDLLKLYYAALIKYRTDKKENAPNLSELVKAGYLPSGDALLDENGKLSCPETRERLTYLRNWEPGTKLEVIIPLKPGSKVLYANGDVRVPGK